MFEAIELLDIKQASVWATEFTGKSVTPSNISYLSSESERKAENFLIQEIECQLNDVIDCTEIENE